MLLPTTEREDISPLQQEAADVGTAVREQFREHDRNAPGDEQGHRCVRSGKQHDREACIADGLTPRTEATVAREHERPVEGEVHGSAHQARPDGGHQQLPGECVQHSERGDIQNERRERHQHVAQHRTKDRERIPHRAKMRGGVLVEVDRRDRDFTDGNGTPREVDQHVHLPREPPASETRATTCRIRRPGADAPAPRRVETIPEPKEWLNVKAASVLIGKSTRAIYEWVEDDRLATRLDAQGRMTALRKVLVRIEATIPRGRPRGKSTRR
ncbi:MAG: hypothetical protein P0Y60_10380 [Candidatus Microbacterium colombiense]|nr:MAG: hypothetical protein P0Y60_10380 [Microbacterium sp.]